LSQAAKPPNASSAAAHGVEARRVHAGRRTQCWSLTANPALFHIRSRRNVLDEELHQLQRIQERADVVQLDDHRNQ